MKHNEKNTQQIEVKSKRADISPVGSGLELMTVGDLLMALRDIDPATEISLRFLPVEGGHRGPDVADVPFSVDLVDDGADKVLCVYLTEA